MAEVKVTRDRTTLAKFREAVEAYRAYDKHRTTEETYPAQDRFIERDRAEHAEVLLQDLERKAGAWLAAALKP